VYSGAVRLLAESGGLEAGELEIIDGGERVEASGGIIHRIVRSGERPPGTPPERSSERKTSGPGRRSPVEVRAERLRYYRSENSIHYTGKVVLTTEDVRMESETLDAVLDSEGREVEQAAARGEVRIRQQDRRSQGELADYYLRPGKVVVTGKPAEMFDP